MANNNIERLSDYLKSNKAKTYPIENSLLKNATDFILNGYLKMLGVILHQTSDITDSQLTIYKRIIAGTQSEKNAEDYLRMALEIEIDDYLNFATEIKALPIRYRFILDAMILTCVSPKNEEQIQLLAEFSEVLHVEKKALEYIAHFAKAILCMDMAAYVSACQIENVTIPPNVFYGYIRLLAPGCIINNNELTIFQPTCKEEVTVETLSQISRIKTPIIKLSNAKVNLTEYQLTFSGYKKVIFDGCEFVGGSKHPIQFINCESVIINNSKFTNFSSRTLIADNVAKMELRNVSFIQCCFCYTESGSGWSSLGGVIWVTDKCKMDHILIDGCLFEACGGKNSAYSFRTQFIVNWKCNVNNTRFVNCWHYHSNNSIDPEDSRRTMFAPNSCATNCIFQKSASLC